MKFTPGQIAHDAGKEAGGWVRTWDMMSPTQRKEWEALANAVIEVCADKLDEFQMYDTANAIRDLKEDSK